MTEWLPIIGQILAGLVLLLKWWLDKEMKKPIDERSAFVIAMVKERSLKREKAINEKDEFATGEQLSNTLDELDVLLRPKDDSSTK